MKIPVSVISFARRELKIRGRSIHNGRGCVNMLHDCTNKDELADRICAAQSKWIRNGLIAGAVQSGETWSILFECHKDATRDNYYRTLCYNAVTNALYVTM